MHLITATMVSAVLSCTLLGGCLSTQQIPQGQAENDVRMAIFVPVRIFSGGVPVVVQPIQSEVKPGDSNTIKVELGNWDQTGEVNVEYAVYIDGDKNNSKAVDRVLHAPPKTIMTTYPTRMKVAGKDVMYFDILVTDMALGVGENYLTVEVMVTGGTAPPEKGTFTVAIPKLP